MTQGGSPVREIRSPGSVRGAARRGPSLPRPSHALDRLKKVTREVGGVAVAVESYDYNGLGALKVNAGVALAHQRPRLDGAGNADAAVPASAGGQAVTLDAGGRVTSLRGTTLTWSRQGFLRQAQEPIPAVPELYGVDSELRRFAKIQGANKEGYVFEGLDRVATITAAGVTEAYLFDGIDHPLRIKVTTPTSTTAYYEVDLAGNVRGLRASGGASLGGYRYSAFGQTLEDTSSITQPLRWKGRWFSPVAGGTYDVRARQWSPELGVFLSVDEFRFISGRTTLWGWPGQSPIRFRDPSGHYVPAAAGPVLIGVGILWALAATGLAADYLGFFDDKPPPGPAPAPGPGPAPAPAPGPGPGPAPGGGGGGYRDPSPPGPGGNDFPECSGMQVTGGMDAFMLQELLHQENRKLESWLFWRADGRCGMRRTLSR